MRRTLPAIGVVLAIVALALGIAWYLDWGHHPVEKMPWLHGQSFEKVLAALGEPSRQIDYTMGTSPGGEFRVELFNTYPPGDPKTKNVQIKEMQWHRHRYHVAVWLHMVNGEWLVLDTCRWQKGVVF
jgi:hypothetical protein